MNTSITKSHSNYSLVVLLLNMCKAYRKVSTSLQVCTSREDREGMKERQNKKKKERKKKERRRTEETIRRGVKCRMQRGKRGKGEEIITCC